MLEDDIVISIKPITINNGLKKSVIIDYKYTKWRIEEEWTMFTYKFSDSKGNIYYGQFKSRDAACEYAYKAGLCFEGRVG